MRLYHIAAVAKNRVIGKDNKLPWHFPEDLKYFKKITTGSTVIMGRKTYESIGKPLPNRENFVLSRAASSAALAESAPNLHVFHSIESAVKNVKTEKAFIIGGAELFLQTINMIDGIYLTRIDVEYEGDAFYPPVPDIFKEIAIERLKDSPKIEVIYYEKEPS